MKQRGNIYVYSAIAIALLALVVAGIFGMNSYINGVDKKGYERGVGETTATFTERDNEQLQALIHERDDALSKVRELEHQHDIEITAAEDVHAKDIAELNTDHDRALARLHREREEARASAASARAGASSTPAADPGKCEGQDWRRIIPDEDQRFFVDEATRADRVVAKLLLCRATLEIERK